MIFSSKYSLVHWRHALGIMGLALLMTSCISRSQDIDPSKKTTIEFEEEVFEFGTVTQGEKVIHTFKFKNTGENPLVIANAKASCGCTVPESPKDPIAPGEEGEISVVFNTATKKGQQTKYVDVVANTEPDATTRLLLKGEVVAPD